MLLHGGKKTFFELIRLIIPEVLGLGKFALLFLKLLHFVVLFTTQLSAIIAIIVLEGLE